jgi:hypothetical protein
MDLYDLSKPERMVWAAFPTGAPVDLRCGEPDKDNPVNAVSWGAGRRVRAEVLMALLLGGGDLEKGRAPAMRLVGARVVGRLDVMGADVSHALVLSYCALDEPPRFVEAATRTVRISDCRLPSFDGARMRTEGILDFHRSVIEQTIRLERAHIIGPVRLRGVTVGNGADEAVAATGLIVEGDMECDQGFTARGRITLHGARITGQLTFRNADLKVLKIAVHMTRLQAEELDLRTCRPVDGAIPLAQARVGVLIDDAAAWPAEIWLNGFIYDVIRHPTGRVPVAERIDWVSRGPYGYQPQPYEQLAEFYRRAGHDDDVRRVLLAKQRHRRTTLSTPARAAGRLLDITVGYGYRPWLAAIWLGLLLTIGTIVFTLDRPTPYPAQHNYRSILLSTLSTCSSPSAPSGSATPTHPPVPPSG